jgi:hypothetical protein
MYPRSWAIRRRTPAGWSGRGGKHHDGGTRKHPTIPASSATRSRVDTRRAPAPRAGLVIPPLRMAKAWCWPPRNPRARAAGRARCRPGERLREPGQLVTGCGSGNSRQDRVDMTGPPTFDGCRLSAGHHSGCDLASTGCMDRPIGPGKLPVDREVWSAGVHRGAELRQLIVRRTRSAADLRSRQRRRLRSRRSFGRTAFSCQ